MLGARLGFFCRRLALACVVCMMAGCEADGASQDAAVHYEAGLVGPAGGIIRGPGGFTLNIPEGALDKDVHVRVALADALEAPALPRDLQPAGQLYTLSPHGLTFAKPAMITLPYEESATTVLLMAAEPKQPWAVVPGATVENGTLTALVKSLSFVVPTRSAPLAANGSTRSRTPA